MAAPTIDELLLADEGERWAALGFAVADGCCELGRVRLRFLADAPGRDAERGVERNAGQNVERNAERGVERDAGQNVERNAGRGIVGWSLRDVDGAELDGLATTRSRRPLPDAAPAHPNGVVAIDHVVAMSPSLERSVRALRRAGLDLRRIREQPTPAGAPRQAFFRLGAEILELIQEPDEVLERTGGHDRPARFWGLAVRVEDLDRTVELLGEHAGPIRPAVQPGRRIATVRRSAGLALPLALMSAPVTPGRPSRAARANEPRERPR